MRNTPDSQPLFSFIVVCYNMARELERTLHSLSRGYQQDFVGDYEVLVVDNGSLPVVTPEAVHRHGPEFRLITMSGATVSPAAAVNRGLSESRGEITAILVDGARLLTPGVLRGAQQVYALQSQAVVAVCGFHLGPDLQRRSAARGYNQTVEDQLLARIDWPEQPYRLFEIACLAESAKAAWQGPMAESNCIFLRRDYALRLGGFEEKFTSPGGGLVNLDFYKRACETEASPLFYLFGEGSFHQFHGGASTTSTATAELQKRMDDEYHELRGNYYRVPENPPQLLGTAQPLASRLLIQGAEHIASAYQTEQHWQDHMQALDLKDQQER